MREVVLVTGNRNKILEMKDKFSDIFILSSESLDILEIQSNSLIDIAKDKAKKAYDILKKPVLVEDSGIFLDAYNGLPGPFSKFFNDVFKEEMAPFLLRGIENRKAYMLSVICFYDGCEFMVGEGKTNGDISEEIRNIENKDVFDFDFCFMPEGHDKTYSELGIEFKRENSNRNKAINQLKERYLEKIS